MPGKTKKTKQGGGPSWQDDETVPPNFLRPQKLRRYAGEEEAAPFIKEATLLLSLQPMPAPVAASWILGSLEGQARDQVLSMEAEEIDSPEKIFTVLHQHWGEHRDACTLSGQFYRRQQGQTETVAEYSAALRRLWGKANAAASGKDILYRQALRDVFANGLSPTAMRRDVKRFLRDQEEATFEDAVKEAQRWMREDDDDTPIREQTALAQAAAIHHQPDHPSQAPMDHGSAELGSTTGSMAPPAPSTAPYAALTLNKEAMATGTRLLRPGAKGPCAGGANVQDIGRLSAGPSRDTTNASRDSSSSRETTNPRCHQQTGNGG